jgi:hypothetical protein
MAKLNKDIIRFSASTGSQRIAQLFEPDPTSVILDFDRVLKIQAEYLSPAGRAGGSAGGFSAGDG